MAPKLPSICLRRASAPSSSSSSSTHSFSLPIQQTRAATLLRRPHRPYQFTQLVQLSDGSTYLTRTTSPAPVHKSIKDTRNHAMWQPSSAALRDVEADEAGRLRAFREKFGRGWDADASGKGEKGEGDGEGETQDGKDAVEGKKVVDYDNYMDLISGFVESEDPAMRNEGGKKKKS